MYWIILVCYFHYTGLPLLPSVTYMCVPLVNYLHKPMSQTEGLLFNPKWVQNSLLPKGVFCQASDQILKSTVFNHACLLLLCFHYMISRKYYIIMSGSLRTIIITKVFHYIGVNYSFIWGLFTCINKNLKYLKWKYCDDI